MNEHQSKGNLLPNHEKAVIEVEKLRDYLLCPEHPVGRYKAAFFAQFGFSRDNWKILETAIRRIIAAEMAGQGQESPFGRKFEVVGYLKVLTGNDIKLRTVWIVKTGETFPRFVTAFPEDRP